MKWTYISEDSNLPIRDYGPAPQLINIVRKHSRAEAILFDGERLLVWVETFEDDDGNPEESIVCALIREDLLE